MYSISYDTFIPQHEMSNVLTPQFHFPLIITFSFLLMFHPSTLCTFNKLLIKYLMYKH